MDKLVRRVTVVQGSGEHRDTKVVYESDDDDDIDEFGPPGLDRLERSVRHLLKAQVIATQDAYQRHLDSAAKGGSSWFFEDPFNFFRARRKAMKEIRKATPFSIPRMKFEDDEDEGD